MNRIRNSKCPSPVTAEVGRSRWEAGVRRRQVVVGMGPRVEGCITPGVSTAKGSALQMATTLVVCGSARKTQVGIGVSTVLPAVSDYIVDASLTVLVLASSPSRVPKKLANLYLRPLRKYNKGT